MVIENPKGNIPLIVRRYIYEAKTSINYAEKNNLDKLHIVVGCAHELPLEFCNTKFFILLYKLFIIYFFPSIVRRRFGGRRRME